MNTSTSNKSKSLFTRTSVALGVMAAGIVATQPALAQEGFTLEEIIVTAQKREQNIQDVPLSVSAMSGESMDNIRSGGGDIRFLSGRAPSLVVESDFGRVFPRFYIRGIGNTDFDQNASQPVSLIYDDVVFENPMLKGFPVFDTARVEVLRGPQGTLFGRNTPAGIVKLDSNKPTEDFEAYVKAGFGNLDSNDLEAVISGGLNDQWSGRLSVLRQSRGDWAENRPSDIDASLASLDDDEFLEAYTETAVRAQLAYEGEDFSALFNVHARDLNGTATLFRANIIEPGSNNFTPEYDREVVYFDGRNKQTAESQGGLAKLIWDLGEYTVTSITGYETVETYSRADVDGGIGADFLPIVGPGSIQFPAQSADGIPDHDQFTQELRINNNDGDLLNWQAGLFYFDEHLVVDTYNFSDRSDAFDGFSQAVQDTTAWAVFAQADYALSDAMTLTAGLRYSDDQKDFYAERTLTPFGGANLPRAYVDVGDDNVSGNLSLSYIVNDQINVYARYARGFRAPSIQGRILFGDNITIGESETADSFEVGVKTELMDNRMRLNVSLYSLTISDQQLTRGDGTTNANQLVNADETAARGIEVDLEWAIAENLLATFGYSFNDTEIKDSALSIKHCGAPCTVLDPLSGPPLEVFIDGNSLPRAPEHMASLTLNYTVPMENGEMYFMTDWAYRSDINFFLYESAEFRGDKLLEGGVKVGYLTSDDKYEFAFYGRNITDEDQLIGAIDFNNLAGIVNSPRTYGVEFTARF